MKAVVRERPFITGSIPPGYLGHGLNAQDIIDVLTIDAAVSLFNHEHSGDCKIRLCPHLLCKKRLTRRNICLRGYLQRTIALSLTGSGTAEKAYEKLIPLVDRDTSDAQTEQAVDNIVGKCRNNTCRERQPSREGFFFDGIVKFLGLVMLVMLLGKGCSVIMGS
ncbi:MAG: hypothetical protein ABT940_07315 [Alphaproteobacteria bacterium]